MTPSIKPRLASIALAGFLLASCGAPDLPGRRPSGQGSSPGAASSGAVYQNVTLSDNTVVLADAAVRGLRSNDGSRFQFASGTPGLDGLRVGRIMVIPHTAVRQVTGVTSSGGNVVVDTTSTTLNRVIRSGTLGWSQTIDWGSLPSSSFQQAGRSAGLQPRTDDFALMASGQFGFSGEVSGYKIDFKLIPDAQGQLGFDLSATRANLIRVGAKGTLSSFRSDARLVYDQGTGELFSSAVHGLQAEGQLEWHAIGVGPPSDKDTVNFTLPFNVPIPIEVGPIPMVLTLKSTLRFVPELTNQSSSGGSFKISYDTDFGFQLSSRVPSPAKAIRKLTAALGDQETVTAGFGPVGFGWGWEFPRLELGVAGLGTYVAITLDTFMDGEFTPGTTLTSDIPPCQRAEIIVRTLALYKVEVLGFSVSEDKSTLWEKNFPFYKDDKPCTLTGR